MIRGTYVTAFIAILIAFPIFAASLDESEARDGEWGYRPAEGYKSAINPPSFVWRYQKGLKWDIQVSKESDFSEIYYSFEGCDLNVHCPSKVFDKDKYFWRYRGTDQKGTKTKWSKVRSYVIKNDAVDMPMPAKQELVSRLPKGHPRLFLRPENLDHLRQLAGAKMKKQYDKLVSDCDKILKNPPDTKEPPKYPSGTVSGSDPWRKIWWGNRTYTQKALNSAATLGFTYMLGGNEKYGQQARRILLECAKWDPKGSTGYRYNDEAGMPYNYYFSRTYSFVNDLLTEQEKETCRRVMKTRGEEMYNHLWPRHLWTPYASHSNRAWHFLGEIAVAFMGEVEGAEDWLWFSMNVFYNMYPAWCDDDGGWHEGSSYWSSYQNRFTWWADIMREAMGVDAFDKPYYSKVGYYMMYLMPPKKVGGGFGDLCASKKSSDFREIMSIFTAQSGNEYWQWWVDQNGGTYNPGGYTGFIRGALAEVKPKEPTDLPSSRVFEGIGQAYMNTQIFDASENVQIAFKSSPFGTQSHGYEANNSFLLWAYGKRLLIRSGFRDSYGSDHHKNWMWSTRSVNNITVDGKGQGRRRADAKGSIEFFKTTPEIDMVIGEAGGAYEVDMDYFTRAVIFVKPEIMIVYDRLKAEKESSYEYWLHAINKIEVTGQHDITVKNGDVLCDINFLYPQGLSFSQTDQYDPNPRERIKLREWHLTAKTADKQKQMEFVTVYRIHKNDQDVSDKFELKKEAGGYILNGRLSDGRLTALLPIDENSRLSEVSLRTKGKIVVRRKTFGKSTVFLKEE